MRGWRYDLHVHSCLSPCADEDMTPCNIAGMAHLNGLEIVALTDHNSTRNAAAFFPACEAYGIVPVAGAELTTAEDIHLVALLPSLTAAAAFEQRLSPLRMRVPNRTDVFGTQVVMDADDVPVDTEPYFLPAATSLPLEDAAALVGEYGGVCYPAHIDRESNGLLAVLGAFPDQPVFRTAELHDAQKVDLADGRQIVVCSDAHRLWELGDGANTLLLDAPNGADADTVRRALFARIREGRP